MKKYSNNLIRTLLKISENQIPFTNHSSFKCFKVILYILQLFGYVYSQYESKPLTRPELDFLAQFTQLSPGTFALLQYGNNTLTKVFFYCIFSTHVLVYITILSLSYIENFDFQWIYKVLNFFFMNFMWMFMTPLQEISIGMMVCGKNSFLSYNTENQNCSVNNPVIQYCVGITGTLLVCFTGFLTVYFFRSYQFFQIDFSRRFSIIAYARLILHQIIIICYYLYLPSLDYIKHMLTHLLLLNIVLDSLRQFPFGFFYEAKFFTAAICCSEYFMILISIWLFFDYNADIIFLSFLIFQPIITTLVLLMNDRQRIQLILDFKPQIFSENSIVFLEETYRCANDYYFQVESKVQFLFIIKCHVEQCDILNCPCQGKTEQFLDPSNNINWQILNNWTQLMFNNILSITLAERRYDDFEYFSLKFSTFLQKYKNNPILSYEILQDIQFQQSQVRKQSNQIKFKPSYYFTQIIQTIQSRNVQRMKEISNKNNHLLSQLEQCLLNNIIKLNDHGQIIQNNILKLLGIQIKFWNSLLQSNFKDFEELKNTLFLLNDAKLECQQSFQQIKNDQSSQLMLRLKLIYALCCDRQYNQIIIFQKKLTQTMINESSDQISSFKASQFLQSSCYTLIGSISQQQEGLIVNKMDKAFLNFFSMEVNDNLITQISQLMPPFLGDVHQHFVVEFLQSGQGQTLNKVFSTYLQNGQGFIEQVKIIINFYFPSITNQQQFLMMSHLRKMKFSQADPSNLDNDTNSEGLILLNKDFRIIGLTENIYDKVSSYLLQLRCTEDIMKNSNIFRMIPKLLPTFIQFYNEFASHVLDQGVTEIGKFSDLIQINYDPSLQEWEKHSQKKRPLSVKERIKTLQRIQNQLECSSNRQISQSHIFCVANQHLIQYTINGQTFDLLFYELTIQLKQQSQKIHTKLELSNRNIRGQVNMQQETNRYAQSLENIDKSEIPILSQANAELIFDEGSVSSLQSGTDDIKLLNEFQKFAKEPHKLNLLKELLYINSALFILFIVLMFIQLLLRQFMLEISHDCLNQQFNIQNSYIIQTSMITLWMQNQFLEQHISQFDQSALNKISSNQQITIGDITQINNQKMNLMLNDWTIYRSYFNDQSIELTQFQNLQEVKTNYNVEKSTIRTYIMMTDVLLQNYKYTFTEQFVDQTILGNALLNLVTYRNSITDQNNQCQSQYKQQSLVVFQVIIYLSYVIIFLFIIYIILKLRQLQDKFWILLNVYQQLDSQQVSIELQMLSIQETFLKQDTPWNKDQQFNEFLLESNYQIENNQNTQNVQNTIITTQRKINLNQKPRRIQIENANLNMSSYLMIMGLFFLLCCAQFTITQIKFTISFNSSSDNFQKVLSVINFQRDFTDSIFLWNIYLQNFSMLNSTSWYPLLLQSFELDYATQNIKFDLLRYLELQEFIGIVGLNQINLNLCQYSVLCEDYMLAWENRSAADLFLDSVLQEGVLLNIQKMLNLIQQNSAFEFQVSENQLVNLYLQSDYFIYFYWGNDIIYKSLQILIKTNVEQFILVIESYLFEDFILTIICGVFITILLLFLIYKHLKIQFITYEVLRESLLFIPYNAQTKLMAKHFLKNIKN